MKDQEMSFEDAILLNQSIYPGPTKETLNKIKRVFELIENKEQIIYWVANALDSYFRIEESKKNQLK